tara:strand:+ start:15109 stop:15366 length:258 start_codon:yes stop_codon:yes gene_type:complete
MADRCNQIKITMRMPEDGEWDASRQSERLCPAVNLRAYFAGQALAGMMANPNPRPRGSGQALIDLCVSTADDLIAALNEAETPAL